MISLMTKCSVVALITFVVDTTAVLSSAAEVGL
jgi:hypothetical protein